MNEIKFSHVYDKLKNGNLSPYKSGTLLEVVIVRKILLSKYFIEYDTSYSYNGQHENYQLPIGQLMLLIFISDGRAWTTLRSYNKSKYEYYLKKRGQPFNITIEEEPLCKTQK